MDLPVIHGGVVRGTVNLPDVAGYFTPARVAVIEAVVTTRHAAIAVAVRAARVGD